MAVVLNDLKQKQLQDKIKEARSKCVLNPFKISELELDIWIFRPKKQYRETPSYYLTVLCHKVRTDYLTLGFQPFFCQNIYNHT